MGEKRIKDDSLVSEYSTLRKCLDGKFRNGGYFWGHVGRVGKQD